MNRLDIGAPALHEESAKAGHRIAMSRQLPLIQTFISAWSFSVR
jgi:hypothetical protein